MYYSGPIKCPNCESPISSDDYVCPYCSSMAPARAPWHRGSWYALVGFAVVALLLMGIDSVFGTQIWSHVMGWLKER